MIFHSGVNAPNSIQDYFGASGWHSFFFSAADLGLDIPVNFPDLTEEYLTFDPSDIDSLISKSRAVSLLTSSVVNGNLVFAHASSLVPMRKMGSDVSAPRHGNIYLHQGRILNVFSSGEKSTLSLQEKFNLLGRLSSFVNYSASAGTTRILIECDPFKANYIDVEFGSVIPNFTLFSVENGVEIQHNVTQVSSNRYSFDNTRPNVNQVILQFVAHPEFDVKSVKLMSSDVLADAAVPLNFALLRPVSVVGSLLPVDADYPFMVMTTSGQNSTAEMRLNSGIQRTGEDIILMHCNIRPQVVEI